MRRSVSTLIVLLFVAALVLTACPGTTPATAGPGSDNRGSSRSYAGLCRCKRPLQDRLCAAQHPH